MDTKELAMTHLVFAQSKASVQAYQKRALGLWTEPRISEVWIVSWVADGNIIGVYDSKAKADEIAGAVNPPYQAIVTRERVG